MTPARRAAANDENDRVEPSKRRKNIGRGLVGKLAPFSFLVNTSGAKKPQAVCQGGSAWDGPYDSQGSHRVVKVPRRQAGGFGFGRGPQYQITEHGVVEERVGMHHSTKRSVRLS